MAEWIEQWGYLAVLIGTSLEGEAILLVAGIFARDGYLRLDLVMLCGFLGSVSADQAWFWVARRFGQAWLKRHPDKAAPIRRVGTLLDRWGSFYVLIFRFLYGLRTISPIAIGFSTIAPLRFAILNFIAAAVWSIAVSGLGYVCGDAIESTLHSVPPWQRALLAIAFVLSLLGCLSWLERRYLRRQLPPE
jgi:membrane protein DedA with SNARE-associated domain